ncbi:MAG: methyltransferase domain-containing protein [Steroidobacteraceae bacterium]
MKLRNAFLFVTGLGFLTLAKISHKLRGYTSPKPFTLAEADRCIDYDMQIVNEWLAHFAQYTGGQTIEGRSVLELGPGSDLGAGLYLLSQGATSYHACDVNDLANKVPDTFYNAFFIRLSGRTPPEKVAALRESLTLFRKGLPSPLDYQVRTDFDLEKALGNQRIDVIFSQAAFEHFDDIDATIAKATRVCRSGSIFCVEVDLQTHSRWIREKDPNNIYRYPDWLFRLFWFRGIPNRVRPKRYAEALRRNGWLDVTLTPTTLLGDQHLGRTGWARRFRDPESQMEYLTVLVRARLP